MATRSKAQIAIDIKAWLQSRLRVIDTGSDTVVSALLLEAYATALGDAYDALAEAQVAQGISDPSAVESIDLDDIAYNLSLTRKPASRSTGFITFRRATAATETIRVGNSDGSGGVVVSSGRDSDGVSVSFITTQTVYFTTSTTKDPVSNLYEVSVPIQAQSSGTSGNKAAGTITSLNTSTNGVANVTNKTASTGGKDIESNDELAVRMASKILGMQPGILEGLRTIALSQAGAQDAAVVGPDDDEFQRSPIGAVDLVVRGSAEATAIDQYTFEDTTAHVLDSKPATGITSVVSTIGLSLTTLTQGNQYSFSQDLVGENRLSVDGNDHLSWLGTNLPSAGDSVIITYAYDSLISTIQDIVDLDSKHYPAADVLVKRGTAVQIDMAFTVIRTSAVDSQTLRDRISTQLTNYIANLKLGADIKQSAIVSQIKAVSGVRTLTVPFTTLARRGSSGASDISLTKYEFGEIDDESLTITVNT